MRYAFVVLLLSLIVFGFTGAAGASVGPKDVAHPLFFSPWQYRINESWQAATKAYYDGNLLEAATILEQLLEEGDVDEVGVRLDLAAIYREMGSPQKSETQYRRLASLLPSNALIAVEHAWSMLALGEADKALALYDRALSVAEDDPWMHFGRGLSLERLNRIDEAIGAHHRAVELDDGLAVAWERIGLLYKTIGRFEDAIRAMEKALRTDPSYTHLVMDLAESYDVLGRPLQAWPYYERAGRIYPSDPTVQEKVTKFVNGHREMLERMEREAIERRRRLVHKRLDPDSLSDNLPVRVGLVERAATIELSAGGDFQVNGRALSGGRWTVSLNDGRIRLARDGEHYEFSEASVRLKLTDPLDTWIALDLDAGRGYFWSRVEDLQVRGDLIVLARPAGLTLVNELDIEEYLLAVVPSEMYPSMPMEALKAQAIAARTYTLRHMGRYESRGFDVMGSVLSSAYRGVDRETARTTEAVRSTVGQVLTYDGTLVEAYYHSTAGGFTASNDQVWGGRPLPYLRATGEWRQDIEGALTTPPFPLTPGTLYNWYRHKPTVFSQGTGFGSDSSFRWILPVQANVIAERVGSGAIGRVVAVVPGTRGIGGWVSSVKVIGTEGTREVRGDAVRSRMGGLKSSAFTVLPLHGPDGFPERFLFVGGGFGHGVGFSQMGAAGMAQHGMNVGEIFDHYYPGTTIESNYGK